MTVVDLLRRLIAIDSVNPDLVAGGAGETAIAAFTAAWLADRGFRTELVEAAPGRPSVVAVAPGSGGGASLMLNGHLDTVALSTYDGDGLTAVEADGRIYGRGAYDMKSGVAAILVAAARAAALPHAGDIVVALVADEECGSTGTEAVLRRIVTDRAVVVEPTGTQVLTGHLGFAWAEVTIHGVAAHGSRPDLGVDAIARTGGFLTGLDRLGRELAGRHPDPRSGPPSIHAGTIAGGVEASSYPDRCTIAIERRTLPGEDGYTLAAELRSLLDPLAAADPTFRYDLAITAERAPFAARADSAVVAALDEAFRTVTGQEPGRRGERFWTDAALLAAAGIDTAGFGVDGGGAHAAREWVTVSSLHTVARTLQEAVTLATAGASR